MSIMRLQAYIRKLGVEEFAAKHGFSVRAATAYMYGARKPKPDDEKTIKLIKNSPVTWNGIYESRKKSA